MNGRWRHAALLLLPVLAACSSPAKLERLIQSRPATLAYAPEGAAARRKDRTLTLSSFVADGLFGEATTVKRTSTVVLPLLVFNAWKLEDRVYVGQAHLTNDYRQFMKDSLVADLERRSRYVLNETSATYALDVKVKKVVVVAPIYQGGLWTPGPLLVWFFNELSCGPASVRAVAQVRLSTVQATVLDMEVVGSYRDSVVLHGYVTNYPSTIAEAISRAIKQMNSKIVSELNRAA